ncbi:hypothetical protein SASPL_107709 [Salvia splendens]|uniref:Uncharacterized protein n=1 Tax=Salvia splendens TaxID=180675 RepID=A0A8X9A5J5_SALSN|nr:hypothetical protein SASPL_107709 [Salvia splendens]
MLLVWQWFPAFKELEKAPGDEARGTITERKHEEQCCWRRGLCKMQQIKGFFLLKAVIEVMLPIQIVFYTSVCLNHLGSSTVLGTSILQRISMASEEEAPKDESAADNEVDNEDESAAEHDGAEHISSVEPSASWNKKRDDLARDIWSERNNV